MANVTETLACQSNRIGQLNPADLTDACEHLELLMPELTINKRDPVVYALAYTEHFAANVLQLEQEREFLLAALSLAWQRAEYTGVLQLVAGLSPIIGRINNSAEAEHILHLGIRASRMINDKHYVSAFLSRLGILLFSQGKYRQGRELWHTGLQLAQRDPAALRVWNSLANFAQISDILGNYHAAQQFANLLLRSSKHDDIENKLLAIFTRGFYARTAGDSSQAHQDYSRCLQILSTTPHSAWSTQSSFNDRQLLMLTVLAELARVQGDFSRAQSHAASAVALAQVFSDHYTTTMLLIDQGLFTLAYGKLADTYSIALSLREIEHQWRGGHIHDSLSYLAHQMETVKGTIAPSVSIPQLDEPATPTIEAIPEISLSRREIEVLEYIATGLSNQEIAEQMVITLGTVKKHLEHIYSKLDVHSRTAALARARQLDLLP